VAGEAIARRVSPAEEAELVRRAAGDDLAAFAALVRAHEASLRRYLARLAGDEGDDLAQESLLAAWRALNQWRGEGSFGGWLRTIATRRFLDSRRTRRVATQPLDSVGAPSHCDGTEQRMAIDRALARLPDRERAAALLLFAHGHSHVEAAAILELPLGTLKSIAARARAALIPLLDGADR
jgi:RNA polymerase sigma-70 factor (ECF subfamily)